MDGERKINLNEGVPLNTAGAANIFLNTGNNTKVNSPNGTVIHLKTEKSSSADVDLHINTTFSIASFKKIKLLFILNFLLSVICMIISCSVAFYYWNELSSMRRQLDGIKDQLIIQSLRESWAQDRAQAAALGALQRPRQLERDPRMETKDDLSNERRYFVEDKVPEPKLDIPTLPLKDVLVAHFNGATRELNLGKKATIGPWSHDKELSSEKSASQIELRTDHVAINESGLYLIYAQIVYLSKAPNCYYIWARQSETQDKPRLLTSCCSADDSSGRPLEKSQISCSTQTVARLQSGDVVNLSQREHNRTLWLRPGYSFFGFVKLSS